MADNILAGSKVLAIGNGQAPQPVAFIDSYEQTEASLKLKYYMWLSRFFIFLAVLSLTLFLSASLALFRLAPQITVKPFLIISQDDSDNIVRAEGLDTNMPSKDKLIEMYVRQYVEVRNTIIDDDMEMRTRWQPGGIMHFLSSPRIFEAFSQYRDAIWNNVVSKGTVQEVEIVSVKRVGGQHSPVWKVDFKTYTMAKKEQDGSTLDRVMTVRYWTASVTAVFIKERLFAGRRLINLLGFTVLRYSQTQVEGL